MMRVFDFCLPSDHVRQLVAYLRSVTHAEELKDVANAEDVTKALLRAIGCLHLLIEAGIPDADLESVLNSLASLIPSVQSAEEATELIDCLCAKVLEEPFRGKEVVMYRPLGNLFYAMGDQLHPVEHRHQYRLLCGILKLASGCERSQYPAQMITLDEALDHLRKWKCNVTETRQFLRLLHPALLNGPHASLSAKVMFELLSTYTTDSDAADALEDARECVRTAMNDPETFVYSHLFRLCPVQRLKGEPIYALLEIFNSGMIADYIAYREVNQEFMANTMGLADNVYMEKMRILTFMSLGSSVGSISMDELGRRLMIDDGNELEQFVIRAVQTRMVQAEIDDVERKVFIRGVKPRSFDNAQWAYVLKGLEKWELSISRIQKQFEDELRQVM
uniref:PCI domain-containing protein n=1 Tax=Trichuris muris TaxID=70415 RepID=A0A5S6R5N5_TRIMR